MRDTIEMAREADLIDDSYASDWYVYQLKAFEALVRADEREACAEVCEQTDEEFDGPDQWDWHSKDYASAIRARGETK